MTWNDYALATYDLERAEPRESAPGRVCAVCGAPFREGDRVYQWNTDQADTCEECFVELVRQTDASHLAEAMGLAVEVAG